jgi:hypothetical protein
MKSLQGPQQKREKFVNVKKPCILGTIRNQMEFYFSDANLSKDRFMQNVIKDGPGNILHIISVFV